MSYNNSMELGQSKYAGHIISLDECKYIIDLEFEKCEHREDVINHNKALCELYLEAHSTSAKGNALLAKYKDFNWYSDIVKTVVRLYTYPNIKLGYGEQFGGEVYSPIIKCNKIKHFMSFSYGVTAFGFVHYFLKVRGNLKNLGLIELYNDSIVSKELYELEELYNDYLINSDCGVISNSEVMANIILGIDCILNKHLNNIG